MTLLEVLALLCAIVGIVGSIVPGIPGPPVSWIGMLICYFAGLNGQCEPVSRSLLFVWLGITTAVTLLDYFIPGWFAKYTGGHKEASWGAVIGLFAGMFIAPVGVLAGALIGAFVGEYIFARQNAVNSAKAAIGAFAGFILGTGLKLAASGVMMFYIVKAIF